MDEQNEVDYSSTVETLLCMFGEVLCKDAIVSIVESCEGDLQEAANIIMNVTIEDGSLNQNQEQESIAHNPMESNQSIGNISNTTNTQSQDTIVGSNTGTTSQPGTMAYSGAISKVPSSGAIPKQIPKKPPVIKQESKEMELILKLHTDGLKTLIFMRGAAGSGKTYLAKNVIDKIYNCRVPGYWNLHIFSTDDFFLRGGLYCFDRNRLSEAHQWNQKRSYVAMSRGLSPVIIDNTNIEAWEMEPYVKEGVKNGYVIILLEPQTPWARKIGQLIKRNTHNVPVYSLERMVNNFESLTSESLLARYEYRYNDSVSKIRIIPEFIPKINCFAQPNIQSNTSAVKPEPAKSSSIKPEVHSNNTIKQESEPIIEKQMQNLQFGNNISETMSANYQKGFADTNKTAVEVSKEITSEEETLQNLPVYKEVEKHLQEAAKIESEWDNGEDWTIVSKPSREPKQKEMGEIKQLPQRILSEKYSPSEKLLSAVENVRDWTIFMPTWSEGSTLKTEQSSAPPIEKITTGTSMEIGDTVLSNSKNPFKVITATPRDINEFFLNDICMKIPEKWMLDKSTTTVNEVMHTPRCKNEEKHFNEFRKLFKYIPRADLRDIFDKCHGDVNWAVDIVLSDIGQKQSNTQDEELLLSDSEGENCENYECDCVAAYNVIPDQNTEEIKPVSPTVPVATTSSPLLVKRKIKKDTNQSGALSLLKQKIEQNIVISDDHYSKHSLKIRKIRRGETVETEETVENESDMNKENMPSTSGIHDNDINEQAIPGATDESDDETISTVDDVEKTISIDVTKDLMSQLDEQFGWKEMVYSSNISTKINIPISILNELNAIWIESLLFQMEENSKQLEIMVKQDEEFARQMAQTEAELLRTTDEPGIPDFKEIMDMDYALSLYHKDVAQWRNNEPSDLAAKLSRDKLKKLFPDLSEDSLVEILMAHDNNFKMTVEALLISTGKSDIMLAHNGVSKFIMDSENEQREKLLEEKNKKSLDSEWPPLPKNKEINIELVKKYREDAEKHLKFRNKSHQKAQELMRRGMTPAATFYSEIASYHKMKYEQANNYAAALLMHLHAHSGNDGDTVDLHFLHVKEAKENLDLFLDEHIQILRNKTDLHNQKLFIITGRGLHSNGGPKIKPAVKRRLRERGLRYSEINPGLLSSKVSATSLLADELG